MVGVGDISRKATVLIFVVIILVSGIQLAQAPQRQILDSTQQPESQKTLSQYVLHNPIYIYGNSDFATFGFSGNGSSSNPYIIEFLYISSGAISIQVYYTDAHFVIRNCYLVAGVIGIDLDHVSNAIIENCVIISGNDQAIRLQNSEFCVITNSSISQSNFGIYLENFSNCTIAGNVISQNTHGINLEFGENSSIRDNILYGNRQTGIILDSQVNSTVVFNNTFGWNGGTYDNIYPVFNAEDNGRDNQWDLQGVGNQWSDYEGEGPYEIQGSANVIDNYPLLLNDSQGPVVEGTDDVSMDLDDEGFTIRWNATEKYPLRYRIYRDGVRSTHDWFGESVEIEFIDFTVGFYNYTIQFEDCAGNLTNDTVVILVYMNMFGGSSTYLILYGSLASILAVVVVVLILKKIR